MQPYTLKRDPFSSHSFIAKTVKVYRPGRILDIGCSTGLIAQALGQDWKQKIWGVDIDKMAAKLASRHYRRVAILDIEKKLPRELDQFDCLIFGDVLEHLVDPWKTLKNCVDKLLVSKGIVLISLPNVVNWYIRAQLSLGNFDYQKRGIMDKTHLRFFTWKSAKAMIEKSGLRIVREKVSPIPLPLIWGQTDVDKAFYWLHVLNNFMTNLRPGFFGYQLMFLCKK